MSNDPFGRLIRGVFYTVLLGFLAVAAVLAWFGQWAAAALLAGLVAGLACWAFGGSHG